MFSPVVHQTVDSDMDQELDDDDDDDEPHVSQGDQSAGEDLGGSVGDSFLDVEGLGSDLSVLGDNGVRAFTSRSKKLTLTGRRNRLYPPLAREERALVHRRHRHQLVVPRSSCHSLVLAVNVSPHTAKPLCGRGLLSTQPSQRRRMTLSGKQSALLPSTWVWRTSLRRMVIIRIISSNM